MVPNTLWKENILYQSEKLISIYSDELKSLNLYDYAKNYTEQNNDGAIGGRNEEETNKHFSERFLTSSARVQYVLIDPNKHFFEISKDLKTTFSSGHISILDIPCGAGAGILSLLSNFLELRTSLKLPRLPLHINITAGDYSQSALDIYIRLLNSAKKDLEKELIYISWNVFLWDGTDIKSTNILLKTWLNDEESYEEFYVLMSAFSGVGSSNYRKFEESFKFIQNYISHLYATTIMIEPHTKNAKNFLKDFSITFKKFFAWLIEKEQSTNDDRFEWYDPITDNIAKSGIIVKQYSRE